jgi:hypothetical protein
VEDPHAWNPLYSTKIRDTTGLNTPWEQWVALGVMIGGPYQAVRLAVRYHRMVRFIEHEDTIARDLGVLMTGNEFK